MDDKEFLAYCDSHSQTELALFSGTHVARIFELANIKEPDVSPEGFYPLQENNMKILLREADIRMNRSNTLQYMEDTIQ